MCCVVFMWWAVEGCSPYVSSTEVPKMMFASCATMDEMTFATSLTSCRLMSELPVMVKTTPRA